MKNKENRESVVPVIKNRFDDTLKVIKSYEKYIDSLEKHVEVQNKLIDTQKSEIARLHLKIKDQAESEATAH